MEEDGPVWLPWEVDSESESEGSGQEVHEECPHDHLWKGKKRRELAEEKVELWWILSESLSPRNALKMGWPFERP